jgi:hypothetical protein
VLLAEGYSISVVVQPHAAAKQLLAKDLGISNWY